MATVSIGTLLRRRVSPAFERFGFVRHGNTFSKSAANGDHVYVAVGTPRPRPGRVEVTIGWTVLPITHWQWYSRNESDPGPPNPNETWFLTFHAVVPPHLSPTPTAPDSLRTRWVFDPDDQDDVEHRLAGLVDYLDTDLVPWLVRMLDRDALLEELRAQTRTWIPGMSGDANLQIMLMLGHKTSEEVMNLVPHIEEYSPTATYREWVLASLDSQPR